MTTKYAFVDFIKPVQCFRHPHFLNPYLILFIFTLDKGSLYEFRVSAMNSVDYGEQAVVTIQTPDGSESAVFYFSGIYVID